MGARRSNLPATANGGGWSKAGDLIFVNHGTWNWPAVLGLLFINCFWDRHRRCVSRTFDDGVKKPEGAGWWGMMVFLIPLR